MKLDTMKLKYAALGLLLIMGILYLFAFKTEGVNWFVSVLILVSLPVVLLLFNFKFAEKKKSKDYTQWYWFGILMATAMVYLPALAHGFSNWDDPDYVLSNRLIRGFTIENLVAIFNGPFKGMYQPLSILSLQIDYFAAGLNPVHHHLTNILLHILNTFLLFSILSKIFQKKEIVMIATLLFAIHPVQVESVAWVTERKNVLFALFYLLSLLQYLKYSESGKSKFLIWSLLGFALSLLAKPQGVMLAPVLLLVDYVMNRQINIKKQVIEKAGFFALALAAGLLVFYFSEGETSETTTVQQIIFGGFAFSKYLIQLIIPVGFSAIYPYPESLEIIHYIGFAFFLSTLVLGLWMFKKDRTVAFAYWFFMLNIVLLLQFVPVSYFLMADRYNYIPSIGIFILLGWLFVFLREKYRESKKTITYAYALFAIVLLVITTGRIQVWGDSLRLWNDVLDKYPNQAEALNNRGFAYYFQGDYEKALADYNQAIKIDPGFSTSYVNRGTLLMDNNKNDWALKDFTKALEIYPKHATAYINRGIILKQEGKTEEALSDFNHAILLDPLMAESYINRGALYAEIGKFEQSISDYSMAIEVDPQNAMAYSNRGLSYARNGNETAAMVDFNRCIDIDPNFTDAYSNRGFIRYKTGRYSEAIADFSYAIKLNPDFANAFMNRGLAYIAMGNANQACPDFQRAYQLGLAAAGEQMNKYCGGK
ncbi:MAG: tetratricopeptide repeat protein [Bacteroidales bacterium]|nr:tetratricopeptide repeat protein [Bacteroidales bacterium]MCF8458680.1 tetratricopeptide repeat protein [Bacteroidales bacterium]